MTNSEQTIQRVPPQDIDAEMAVLGAMFLESEAVPKAMELLDENSFYHTAHQKIFRAALKLYDERQPIDAITMADKLKKLKELVFINLLTGSTDVDADFIVKSLDELNDLVFNRISKIDGLIGTETSLIMEYLKEDYSWGTAFD